MADRKKIARIIDANLNRALEGLRTVEDSARFHSSNKEIVNRLKQLRHKIPEIVMDFGFTRSELLRERDSIGDVGRELEGSEEYNRNSEDDIVAANFSRIKQALRSIEEHGKLINTEVAKKIEALRYQVYEIEKDYDQIVDISNKEITKSGTTSTWDSCGWIVIILIVVILILIYFSGKADSLLEILTLSQM